MESPNPHPATPHEKLRWYQYRLRTLFVLMLLVSIGMSWVEVTIQGYKGQQDAAAAIEKAGGRIVWAPEPIWLGKVLRDDSLRGVLEVWFDFGGATDAEAVHLEAMGGLRILDFDCSDLTDAGLAHLRDLRQLQVLNLSRTKITDVGLKQLRSLDRLRELRLEETDISDAGLASLQYLRQLRYLDLESTRATDEGVLKLRKALPNCRITFFPLPKNLRLN